MSGRRSARSCCASREQKRRQLGDSANHSIHNRMSFLGRIREGLARTKQQIVEQFEEIVLGADAPEKRTRSLDVDTLDALEELLISADLGMAASSNVIAAVKSQPRDGTSLRDLVKREIRRIFNAADVAVVVNHHPKVVLIVGVNGTGKT